MVIFQRIQGLRSVLLILNLWIAARGKLLPGHVRVIEVIIGKDAWRVLRFRMSTRVKYLLLGHRLMVLTLLILGCLNFFEFSQFGRVSLVEGLGGWAGIERCKRMLFGGKVLIRVFCVHLTVFTLLISIHLAGRKRLQLLLLLLILGVLVVVVGMSEIENWR